MARISDIPVVLREVGPWSFPKRILQQIGEDNIFVWAAALAYSWLFAIFPFLIFLLTLVPYLPLDKQEVMQHISTNLNEQLPQQTAQWLEGNISRVLTTQRQGLMSLGIVVTLWAASGGMAMTMSALDRCYDIDENRPFYKQRPIALLLTVVVAVLILTIMLLLPIGTLAMKFIEGFVPTWLLWLWSIARWALGTLVMFLVLSVVYHFGPRVKQSFRLFTPGALFTVIAWIGMGLFFRAYINVGKYDQTYGAVGGAVVLLFIFYANAAVLLIGAEINSEIDFAVLKVPAGTLDFRRPSKSMADPNMPSP